MALIRVDFPAPLGPRMPRDGWTLDGEGKILQGQCLLVSNTEMFNLNHDFAPLPLIYMNKKIKSS